MTPRLSRRSDWPLETSSWADAVAHARGDGGPLWDLTEANPTHVGFHHPPDTYAWLTAPGVERYEPEPLGLPAAREAVAAYYARRGRVIAPEQVWIVASTSEAYHDAFFLLGDPGDAIAVPTPGYPLLDHLTALSGLRRVTYRLEHDGGWYLDLASVAAAAADPTVRMFSIVSPHNPCGHVLAPDELDALQRTGLPLLLDEVFADYPLDGQGPLHLRPREDMPSLTLSGLSKVAALPQLKLSWVVVDGPRAWRDAFLARAEVVSDAFLSTATPVQRALPPLLLAAEDMQSRLRARCRDNLAWLDRRLVETPVQRLPALGGWTALLRLPALPGLDDDGWARVVLAQGRTVTMPGYLFDLERPPRLAVSLLTDPETFRAGIERILEVVATACR